MSDHADCEENADPRLAKEPMLRIEPKELIDPIEHAEPTEPTDRNDPFEPIDKNESWDHKDHERAMAKFFQITHLRARGRATVPGRGNVVSGTQISPSGIVRGSLLQCGRLYRPKDKAEIMKLTVYLAGEIHTDWRDELISKTRESGLDLEFVSPQLVHDRSDDIGEAIQGTQPNAYFRDLAASDVNNFRTEVLLNKADIVIALFGEKYRQWNTAMDLSTAIALGKPSIMIRPESLIHPLKELSRKTNVTVGTVDQAVEVLSYVFE